MMRNKKNNHCICGMCVFHKSGYGCTLDKHHRAKNKQLQAELEKHRWIPVSERLPEKKDKFVSHRVLVLNDSTEYKAIWVTSYNFRVNEWMDKYKKPIPTHWKPIILPEDKPDA